ncbi:hypothetical protein AB6V29_09220 [Microbacterium sp. 20-116]|uniref:hypothetical protein n=1 Tax=Microbacterium sp. 20-116 TaxID=3239883 RepID=UPI0034E2E258
MAALAAFGLTSCATAAEQSLDVGALAESASAFQAEILQDGVVDPAEYERAVLAKRQCVTDTGATVSDVYPVAARQLTFDWEVEAETEEEVVAINNEAAACDEEFLSAVGVVWAEQNLLSTEDREKLRPEVISCLQENGGQISPGATYDEIVKYVSENIDADGREITSSCLSEFPEYFMISVTNAR